MVGTHIRQAGFTLVEVLVALTIMAVLTGLAWRGLDGMLRARDISQQAVERTARLNTILAQWEQDLNAVHDSGAVPALTFDGQTLLLTRTRGDGMAVVAWSLRGGAWLRWVGPTFNRAGQLQEGWLRGQQLLGNEAEQLRLLEGVTQWQVYFYRDNAWTNPQSTGNVVVQPPAQIGSAPARAPREELPEGVRLVVTTDAGVLTRDIDLGRR